MKKVFFVLVVVFGLTLSVKAQYAEIANVRVSTSNGTYERSKVSVTYCLTSEGMKAVYENGKNVNVNITATYPINQLLKTTERSDTFYPNDNGNGRRRNAQMIEFECIDHETAIRLERNGVSTSDFSIRSSVR
jgi:hypothetical protein